MPDSRLLIPEEQRRQLRSGYRRTRALWRTVRVVWREFRTPIVVFLVAMFLGGWLYGRLWNRARPDEEHKPYIDMPYTMVTLMIFASPDDLPVEAELVVFWYVMPLIGAYVAGRGVFDFVSLFFITTERRNSWEEAMASTYDQHVIVLGVGHLGTRVVRQLVKMGFEVVAIDIQENLDKLSELKTLGVRLILGDGRLEKTLKTAGIEKARSLIVCTSNDHMNLEVTMRARDLNPDLRIVVRMWEDQFAQQIQQFMNVEAVLSTTNLAAPSFAASALGIDATQTLQINGEDYSMIRLHVTPGSFMDGKTIGELQESEDMDIVLHSAAAVEVHPAKDLIVKAGDTLVLFARHAKVAAVVGRNHGQRMTTVE